LKKLNVTPSELGTKFVINTTHRDDRITLFYILFVWIVLLNSLNKKINKFIVFEFTDKSRFVSHFRSAYVTKK